MRAAALFAALLLGACATTPHHLGDPSPGRALGQPLRDLNLLQENLPPSLEALVGNPYNAPSPHDCPTVNAELAQIDRLLGPDVDIRPDSHTRRSERENAAVSSLLTQLSTSWIPGRDIVRAVTGAQARERRLREAVLAGALRRAYLRGVAAELGCAPQPAGPVAP